MGKRSDLDTASVRLLEEDPGFETRESKSADRGNKTVLNSRRPWPGNRELLAPASNEESRGKRIRLELKYVGINQYLTCGMWRGD